MERNLPDLAARIALYLGWLPILFHSYVDVERYLDQGLGLTRREQDVLDLVADGLTNIQIGERLFLSARTVEHHLAAVMRKLNVATRGEAVAAAGRRASRQSRGRSTPI